MSMPRNALARLRSRVERRPAGTQPPGSAPRRTPLGGAIVILIVVLVAVLWLLARGWSTQAALAAVAGTAVIAVELVVRLRVECPHQA
ncbi:hypothetical protein [Actinomadura fibrosa]|uniref:DUF3040 domain-containing protein n=1 Tax=Actinomadura fibrosa TaxID=111802 RepID=A0ABW2XQN6_9ACTN|nr:hypothetical protein [Actinomadura fibrosa]